MTVAQTGPIAHEHQAAASEKVDREEKALRDGLAAAAKRLESATGPGKAQRRRAGEAFPRLRGECAGVQKAIAQHEKDRPPPLETVAAFVETDPNPPPHHVMKRGQHNAPGAEVGPGVPAAFCTSSNGYRLDPRPAGRVSSGRRTAFARWVTSPENPLFARVMVNRVWQHHFGTGLVRTPDNLGQSGAAPSHPELLDYLATELVRNGWSLKALHRLILTSAVYRQGSWGRFSLPNAPAGWKPAPQVDPDNRLLWRFPLRRLDAEALRDALLGVSGELDPRTGGPYVPSRRTADGSVEVAETHTGARRRSVYLQQRRTQVATLLQLFDAPAIVGSCSARTTSTVPLQALALLNSDFARLRARSFAQRLAREAGPEPQRRLALAFRLACGREPVEAENSAARRFLAAQAALYAGQPDATERAWTDLCQMVLASNAFLYVE